MALTPLIMFDCDPFDPLIFAHHFVEAPPAPADGGDIQEYEAVQHCRITTIGNGKEKGAALSEGMCHPVSERHMTGQYERNRPSE